MVYCVPGCCSGVLDSARKRVYPFRIFANTPHLRDWVYSTAIGRGMPHRGSVTRAGCVLLASKEKRRYTNSEFWCQTDTIDYFRLVRLQQKPHPRAVLQHLLSSHAHCCSTKYPRDGWGGMPVPPHSSRDTCSLHESVRRSQRGTAWWGCCPTDCGAVRTTIWSNTHTKLTSFCSVSFAWSRMAFPATC